MLMIMARRHDSALILNAALLLKSAGILKFALVIVSTDEPLAECVWEGGFRGESMTSESRNLAVYGDQLDWTRPKNLFWIPWAWSVAHGTESSHHGRYIAAINGKHGTSCALHQCQGGKRLSNIFSCDFSA